MMTYMARYLYSVVRCVPDPRTGEFVNVGAIVGSPETSDWALRQVSSESRVRKMAGVKELEAVHGFLARVGERIDEANESVDAGAEPLTSTWLHQLHHDHRNVVQVSAPTPVVASDAESALDVIFDRLIIDPVSQRRDYVGKARVVSALRAAYRRAEIDDALVRPRSELFVGGSLHALLDFAIANGSAVQICQAWSFQRASVEQVTTDVKAWGYAVSRLRDGEEARLVSAESRVSSISSDVPVEVVVALPKTSEQERAYEESSQVFDELSVAVVALDEVDSVGARAAERLSRHSRRARSS